MQRKAYVPGVAVLLAAALAGCTGSADSGDPSDGLNSNSAGTVAQAAQPGRYATLPEPCGVVGKETLDELLPGIEEMTDADKRQKAYAGEATLTYDTDRKVGCRWKVESEQATDHLLIDFERVVSYDNTVSDDSQAQELFATRQREARLLDPTTNTTENNAPSTQTDPPSSSESPTTGSPPPDLPDLRPRLLDDLGDEAFLDDELNSSGSTAQQRTVTVAFRTSNVIVTVEYAEQPMTAGEVPDSKEMQDRARELASKLAEALNA